MEIRKDTLLSATTIILLSIGIVQSQQVTTSPTPSPSKTATVTIQSTITTASPSQQHLIQAQDVKTQTDLNILTGNIQRPNAITWANDKIFTACTGDWTLYEIDPNTGTTVQYIYGVRNAHTIYPIYENGELHLWIPDFQSNTLIHIHRGTTETVTSDLEGPWGIADLSENTFAITSLSSNSLVSVNKDGETKEIINQMRSPSGIAADAEHIYIANTGSTRRAIEWFTKSELQDTATPIDSSALEGHSLISGLQNTTNLTIGPDNLLYFSYALGTRGVVGRVDPETCRGNKGCTSDQVEIILYTELAAPLAGLSISPDMKLYIHSIFSPDIYWVQLETT